MIYILSKICIIQILRYDAMPKKWGKTPLLILYKVFFMENFDFLKQQKEKIFEIIEPVVKDYFMELVDIEINKNHYLRVIIDKREGKVNINDCELITNRILEINELDEIMKGNFTLEVSSPGINRPLTKPEDYERFKGQKVKIITKNKIGNENVFVGILKGFNEGNVIIEKAKKEIKISLMNIKRANLDIDLF